MNSNIKLAIRNLLKNKGTTFINIAGLSVALVVSILLFSIAFNERSMDSSQKAVNDIYVISESNEPGVSKPIADWLTQQVPELGIVTICNYEWSPQVFLKKESNNYKVEQLLVADSNYFKVFEFPLLYGDANDAMLHPDKIVLTEQLSRKIFGDQNPVGKSLEYNSTYLNVKSVQVGAVIKSLPNNSSWSFDAVLPITANLNLSWYNDLYQSWGAWNYCGFARLRTSTDSELVSKHLSDIDHSLLPKNIRNDKMNFSITPFRDSYFKLPAIEELKHGNSYINLILHIIAVMILLLACVNYISMVTAQREKWIKTIGIAKSLGSSKSEIIRMVMAESSIILIIVLLITISITPILLSSIQNSFFDSINKLSLFTPQNISILACTTFCVWMFTGFIPGYLLSKYDTSLLLRKLPIGSINRELMKNGMLVFQFIVTIILISGMLIIQRQNKMISNNTPGFVKGQIIVASTNKDIQTKIQAFKNDVRMMPRITAFTFCSEPIGNVSNNTATTMEYQGDQKEIGFTSFWVSPNFFDFFGIQFNEGSTFNKNSFSNKDFILNQKALDDFGIEKLQDARINIDTNKNHGQLIGGVENFNFQSLHVPIKAAGFMCAGEAEDIGYFKINAQSSNQFKRTIAQLDNAWNKLSPDYPFEYTFLDQSWANLYQRDKDFQQLINYATLLSILLSCMGLIGLSYFILERKTKEIGIRKVNGAKILQVIVMLNKDFLKWIVIAFVIAAPIASYSMNHWLQNFAYKTELSWWIFALAGILALGIALLTVSWQSWRASNKNPVEALRYE
nr:FtsX-like permease family protein [uncultured Carboxylicivirga sp.]